MSGWLYGTFLVLTLTSIVLGAALVVSGTMRRLGAFAIVVALVELLLFAVFGDLRPLLFYVATAPIGVWLVWRVARSGRVEDGQGRPPAEVARAIRFVPVTSHLTAVRRSLTLSPSPTSVDG